MANNKNSGKVKKGFKKKHLIIVGVVLLAVFLFVFSRNGEETHSYTEVERGNIVQELFETGVTEKGEDVSLAFPDGGRIERVFVTEGQEVKRGETVATLDKRELHISLREAQANLNSAQASLERVLTGATDSEVNVARASVSSAESSLESAKESLEKQESVANEMLRDVFQGTPTFLGDVYSSVREVELGVVEIARKHFASMVVSETTSGRRSRDAVRRSAEEIKKQRDIIREADTDYEKRENTLKKTEEELKKIVSELDNLISVAESDFYEDRFSDAEKDTLRTYRRSVNTLLGEITSLLGKISSVNAEIDASLTSARSSVSSAESALNQAKTELSRVSADPERSEVRVREAAVDQARSRIELIQKKIQDASLKSPVNGIVSNVFMRQGEIASPASPVVVVSPEEDLQIAVDIYEGDIAKVNIGDEVKASFVAFEGQDFEGEVVFINPTGKVIDGVIYYEIKIVLDEYPQGVLPQMTVDVTIRTQEKEDALFIPERAVSRRDNERFVRVVTPQGEYEERKVQTGLRGEGRVVEIISGLSEGERVIVE